VLSVYITSILILQRNEKENLKENLRRVVVKDSARFSTYNFRQSRHLRVIKILI
jgi:hypothetical protein